MIERLDADLTIVGAGPAGLAAANEASRLGLNTLLIDDQPQPGGRLQTSHHTLAMAAARSGTILRSDVSVFGVSDRGALLAEGPDASAILIESPSLILATGAVERPLLIPGWTLKNVLSAGEARRRGLAEGLPASGPVVLAGHGAYLLSTAARLAAQGRPAVAVIDTGRSPLGLGGRMLFGPHKEKARRMLSWLISLRRHGTQVHTRCTDLRLDGENGTVRRLSWTDHDGRAQSIEAAVVLVHNGLDPDLTLPRALGVPVYWNGTAFLPETDRCGATPIDDVWLAGANQGAIGPEASIARGHLAAINVCAEQGLISADEANNRGDPWRAILDRETDLARKLASLSPPAAVLDDETVVCHCLGVTAGRLRGAVARGAPGPNMAQAVTGCSTGPCQGRFCAPSMTRVLAEATGQDCEEVGLPRPRQPIRPVHLGVLAAFSGCGS